MPFAQTYKAVDTPIAAGVLYQVSGLLLPRLSAALAVSLSLVSVVFNARDAVPGSSVSPPR
jgi:cation transport ATPase